jgi:hypothetical protein
LEAKEVTTKRILSKIRGWFPKEPILPSRTTPSQAKLSKTRAIFQNLIVAFLVFVGLFCSVLLLSNSWIKIALIGLALVTGVLWLVSRGKLRSALKLVFVAVMIFSISFTAVESYLFWNGGYPATYSTTEPQVTLSMQKMLNSSVEQIVQSAEKSQTLSLLKLEHGGNITFESLNLSPARWVGGYIGIDFASKTNNAYFRFYSSDGHQYIVEPSTYGGQLMSQLYPSNQTADMALKRIDALGLNWFYNQALEIAQRTANLPTIDSVDITITFGGAGSYQGLTLQLIGYHQTILPNGGISGDGVLISEFEPNGTLLYMSKPSPVNGS